MQCWHAFAPQRPRLVLASAANVTLETNVSFPASLSQRWSSLNNEKPTGNGGFFFCYMLHRNMALISFKDWRQQLGESSPTDRLRIGWARGNYPPSGSIMSRSTPPPYIMNKAKEEFGTPEHPKKKKKHKKKKEDK